MFDAKVMHEPSAKFLYEVRCQECRSTHIQVTVQRGCFCQQCGVHDPSHKTWVRLVKP